MTAFLFLGCGLKVGEQKPINEDVQMNSISCVDKSLDDLKLFFKGESKKQEVTAIVSCFSNTLKTFSNSVSGESKDFYTATEIKRFIENNLKKETNKTELSLDLVNQLFKFKTVVVGGYSDRFSRKEIIKLANILDAVKDDVANLNPYMLILTGQWDYKQYDLKTRKQKYDEATEALDNFSYKLFSKFEPTLQYLYSIHSLMDFVKTLMEESGSTTDDIQKIESYRSLAVVLKHNTISQGEYFKLKDWPSMGRALSAALQVVLANKYFSPEIVNQKTDFDLYAIYAQKAFTALSYILNTSGQKQLSEDQLKDITQELFKALKKEVVVDPGFVKALTVVKSVFVQKNSFFWTVSDFVQLAEGTPVFFNVMGSLLNLLDRVDAAKPTDKQQVAVPLTSVDFDQLENQFNIELQMTLPFLKGQFDINQLEMVLTELQNAKLIGEISFLKDYSKKKHIISAVAEILTHSSSSVIAGVELQNVVETGLKAYLHYSEYDLYLNGLALKDVVYSERLLKLWKKAYTTLQAAIERHPQIALNTDDIASSYGRLVENEVFKSFITEESLRIVLTSLYKNFLINPENRIKGFVLPGLTNEAVDNLDQIISPFLQANMILAPYFKTQDMQSYTDLIKAYKVSFNDSSVSADVRQIYKEHLDILEHYEPLTSNGKGQLQISSAHEFQIYKYDDVVNSNLFRTLSRLLIRSLAQDSMRIDQLTGVTQEELQQAFDMLKPVIYEFDWVAQDNPTFISSRFREANLFVPHANGDTLANYYELHDLIVHLMSGTKRAKEFKKGLVAQCLPLMTYESVQRKTPIEEACVLDYIYKTDYGFDELPIHKIQRQIFTDIQMKEYYFNVLKAAGYKVDDTHMVLAENSDDYPHAIQYIEMLFAKYDADNNGQLDKTEALKAFPVFKETIRSVIGKIDGGDKIKEDKYPGVFIYFLKYGKSPKTMVEKLQFMAFINNEAKWIVNSTRPDIGKVFAFLNE